MQHLVRKQQLGAGTGPRGGLKRREAVRSACIATEEPASAQSQAPSLHLESRTEGNRDKCTLFREANNERHFGKGERKE